MKVVLSCLALAAVAAVGCASANDSGPTQGSGGGQSGGSTGSGGTTAVGNGGSAVTGTGGTPSGSGGSAIGSGGTSDTGGSATGGGGGNVTAGSAGAAGSGGGNTSGGAGGAGPAIGACTPARPKAPGLSTVMISVGGRDRTYLLHVPKGYDGTKQMPVVVDIHGLSSWADEQRERSKWDEMADKEGFILIEGEGVGMSWAAGGFQGHSSDMQYFRDVVKKTTEELCADSKRVYVTGHSNGGAMTLKLACQAADIFAAAASVCGWSYSDGACNPARPIPYMSIRATSDGLVPANDADGDVDKFTSRNECADMPVVTSGVCKTQTSCEAGTQVADCRPRGGHDFFYGNNPDMFYVPEKAWAFFKQFSLP